MIQRIKVQPVLRPAFVAAPDGCSVLISSVIFSIGSVRQVRLPFLASTATLRAPHCLGTSAGTIIPAIFGTTNILFAPVFGPPTIYNTRSDSILSGSQVAGFVAAAEALAARINALMPNQPISPPLLASTSVLYAPTVASTGWKDAATWNDANLWSDAA